MKLMDLKDDITVASIAKVRDKEEDQGEEEEKEETKENSTEEE